MVSGVKSYFFYFFILQSVAARQGRACYQRGLPRIVYIYIQSFLEHQTILEYSFGHLYILEFFFFNLVLFYCFSEGTPG